MRAAAGVSLIVACAVVGLAGPREAGAAAVLCQKKSGALSIRQDACKKKETLVDIDQLIPRHLHETVIVTESDMTGANTTDVEHTVACPAGYQAIGGGVAGEFNQIGVDASGPSIGGQPTNTIADGTSTTGANGWFVRVFSFGADAEPYKVSAICAKPAP